MLQKASIKRMTAWIAMIAVFIVMLFSVMYISQHADHECTGADCHICAVMEQCENNIKTVGTVFVAMVIAFLLCASIHKSVQCDIIAYSDFSLISQKVRLNI